MCNEYIVDKIRKLIRLSHSDNEHEAAAAAAMAQELLSKYNLSMESVSTDSTPQHAQKVAQKTRQRLEDWAYMLAGGCADAFDCRYYHTQHMGETNFLGVGPDPEVCAWMFGYLYKTLLRLASKHMAGPARRLRSTKSKKAARDSFLRGAVGAVTCRLSHQKKITPVTGAGLVVSKTALIEAAMPKITTIKVSPKKLRERDVHAGKNAASAVPLSTPVHGSVRQPLALES